METGQLESPNFPEDYQVFFTDDYQVAKMMMMMITVMTMMMMMMTMTMTMMESMMETSQLGSPNFPENYKVAMMLMITVMVVMTIMMMIAVMVIIKDFYFCLVAPLYIITFAKQMRQKSKNIKTSWFIDATST